MLQLCRFKKNFVFMLHLTFFLDLCLNFFVYLMLHFVFFSTTSLLSHVKEKEELEENGRANMHRMSPMSRVLEINVLSHIQIHIPLFPYRIG